MRRAPGTMHRSEGAMTPMNIPSVAPGATPGALAPRPYGSSPADLDPPRPRPVPPLHQFSRAGEVFGRLSGLQQSDPSKLKATAAELAGALRAEGTKLKGPSVQALGKLANAFDKVAASGDLSALAPPPPSSPSNDPRAQAQVAASYARQGPPPSTAELQAMQQAMSFVASQLGVD